MSGNFIEINNLNCSYSLNEKEKVLFIRHLVLERGKLIFLLGASGSGKSTLLETLGLMNNTIAGGNIILNLESSQHNYTDLWKSNPNEITQIRKKHLSFIFQNTNLMENFTAYENISLAPMIKGNLSLEKANDNSVRLMNQVKLPLSEVGMDALAVNLSGGQRQRVSFVRALNNEFKLLLCDEPTGNLDEVNANELIQIIKQNISEDKSAVVVSHDIRLALKYADQIILLTKNPEKGYGEILEENILNSNDWANLSELELFNFKKSILEKFSPDAKATVKTDKINNDSKNKNYNNYRQLFIKKESDVLYGKNKSNLIVIAVILLLTFLAIGFANGTLDYLDKKRKDPFVTWLAITIPSANSSDEKVGDMLKSINSDDVRMQYNIKIATAYNIMWLDFFYTGENKSQWMKGRILKEDDPLEASLFDSITNRSHGASGFLSDSDLGIVVTQKLLNKFGYSLDSKVIYFNIEITDSTSEKREYIRVPVPIRSIVKEIPGKNYFIVNGKFYKAFMEDNYGVFNPTGDLQRNNVNIYSTDKKVLEQLEQEANAMINKDSISINPVSEYQYLNENGWLLHLQFNDMPDDLFASQKLFNRIINLDAYKKNNKNLIRLFDYNSSGGSAEFNNDYLSLNFTGLDKVDEFAKDFYKIVGIDVSKSKDQSSLIEIDTGAIKEKKNFDYMSKMTYFITSLLILFSILSISLFISNLLRSHLNKVKMNIGTYKAFGLGDNESSNIYLIIMLRFVILGLIIAFTGGYIIGYLSDISFSQIIKIEEQKTFFQIFDWRTGMLVGLLLIVTISVSYINIKRILSKTPGDLIYNR